MPTRTDLLDSRNFVYWPQGPEDPGFLKYLDYADRLLADCAALRETWSQSSPSAEVLVKQQELDRVVSDFIASFRERYALLAINGSSEFMPVSRYFAKNRPIRQPFSILHCDLEMPLHTVYWFESHGDLAKLNAALDEDTPLSWWQPGPHQRPCYLFGPHVWELTASEAKHSDHGILLLFAQMSEANRCQSR